MGHYWSEMRPDDTPEEREQCEIDLLAKQLCKLSASRFTVNELKMLMRTDWSKYKERYYPAEYAVIRKLAKREGVL